MPPSQMCSPLILVNMFPLQIFFLSSLCFGALSSATYFNFTTFETQTELAFSMMFANFEPTTSQQLCAGLCSINITCHLFVYHQEVCYFGNYNSANGNMGQGILEDTVLVHVDTGLI